MVLPANSSQLGQPHGRGRRRAAGDAAQDALLAGQPAGDLDGLVVLDLLDPVDDRQVEVVGDEAGADALDLVRARLERLAGQLLA